MASRILLAAEQGDRKSMQAFITERQVNVVNEEGSTPLMVAAANGRDEIIRLLLEQEVSDINIKINVILGGGHSLKTVLLYLFLNYKSHPRSILTIVN